MEQETRVLQVDEHGAVVAVQRLLWRLMEKDVVQALLVPLQTHLHEAPAPTLIKTRERLDKTNPLAPVMTLNSAKVVGMLMAQESGKRLAAVLRPCEARALIGLADQGRIALDDLITISIDCLGSHDERDYEQRATLWGNDIPTRESLRWSRRGQIASYRFRQACQVCERPHFDGTDIGIGLLGQNLSEGLIVNMEVGLADQIGLGKNGWTAPVREQDLVNRQKTIARLVAQRQATRRRLLGEMSEKTAELADLLTLFGACTLCAKCQEACPFTSISGFEMDRFAENSPEYLSARLLDIVHRAEDCVGCGMCDAACHIGLPLMLVTQLVAEQAQMKEEVLAAFVNQAF